MKLAYTREGGLFPQVAETEVQLTDLPTDLQPVAKQLFDKPDAYRAESAKTAMRDGYQYRINLQEGRKKISLTFDDLSLPEAVQPLVQFLQQQTGKP